MSTEGIAKKTLGHFDVYRPVTVVIAGEVVKDVLDTLLKKISPTSRVIVLSQKELHVLDERVEPVVYKGENMKDFFSLHAIERCDAFIVDGREEQIVTDVMPLLPSGAYFGVFPRFSAKQQEEWKAQSVVCEGFFAIKGWSVLRGFWGKK